MLQQIHIRHFAIIEQLELELAAGMTVLTGETGAGKSILIDALGLVLGERADSGSIRHGNQRTEVSASFDITALIETQTWLQRYELDDDGECMIRRVVSAEGRSKAYINGRPAPLQLLKALGEQLVDIHGQNQHQSLIKGEVQRQRLDEFCHQTPLLTEVTEIYQQWHQKNAQLEELTHANSDREARLELLNYHLQELETLALEEDELEALEEEQRRLASSGQLRDSCQAALEAISERDDNAALLSTLNQHLSELQQLKQIDPQLAGICTLLEESAIQIQEAADELRHYNETIDLDPQRLSWVEQRLSAIYDLARKHHIEAPALITLQQELQQQQTTLNSTEHQLDALQREIDTLAARYLKQAKKLSKKRQQAATQLGHDVTTTIAQLGMSAGELEIQLKPRESERPHPHGLEQIEFLVSTNRGQPLRPLHKVASGGELSRIALAIQVATTHQRDLKQAIPTLIFDEVDTGIGGAVAETVGQLLHRLGATHQVLCVTHLAQVAAQGHHHLRVEKQDDAKTTSTTLSLLTERERPTEIARMLGGVNITKQTRAHAVEMMKQRASTSTS